MIDFTPEIKEQALKIAAQYKFAPLFTPPIVAGSNGLYGVLMLPALIGGRTGRERHSTRKPEPSMSPPLQCRVCMR